MSDFDIFKNKHPPTILEYVPASSQNRRSFRFRVVVTFAVLAVISYFISQHFADNLSDNARVAAGNWFVFALFFGSVSGLTAFLNFLFTGRPW